MNSVFSSFVFNIASRCCTETQTQTPEQATVAGKELRFNRKKP